MTINKMSCEQDSVEQCSNSNIEPVEVNDVHQRKYFALKQKCEQLQQTNEKLVNRIHQVKRILKRYKKEKRFIIAKLDGYGDCYQNVQVPAMWEEGDIQRERAKAAMARPAPAGRDDQQSATPDAPTSDTTTSEKLTNAFFMFSQQRTPIIQEQYFDEHHHEMEERKLVQRLTQEWNELTSDTRMMYSDLYERDIMKPKDEVDVSSHNMSESPMSQLY